MGVIRDVINSFDNSDELGKVQREAVEALAALGQSKAETYKLQIEESLLSAGNGTNLTVPVASIGRSLIDVRAYSSTEVDKIGSTVSTILTQFLQGTQESVVGGIGSLITGALEVFLGKASASSGIIEEYYVATKGLSFIRVDIKAWYMNVSAESIKSKMERVSAVVAVQSIVDLKKLDFSTFLYLYQDMLQETKMTSEEIKQALKEAREIYADYQKVEGIDSGVQRSFVVTPPAALARARSSSDR